MRNFPLDFLGQVRNFPLDFLGQVRNFPLDFFGTGAEFSPAEKSPYRIPPPPSVCSSLDCRSHMPPLRPSHSSAPAADVLVLGRSGFSQALAVLAKPSAIKIYPPWVVSYRAIPNALPTGASRAPDPCGMFFQHHMNCTMARCRTAARALPTRGPGMACKRNTHGRCFHGPISHGPMSQGMNDTNSICSFLLLFIIILLIFINVMAVAAAHAPEGGGGLRTERPVRHGPHRSGCPAGSESLDPPPHCSDSTPKAFPAPTAFPTARNSPPPAPNRFHIPCGGSATALGLLRSPSPASSKALRVPKPVEQSFQHVLRFEPHRVLIPVRHPTGRCGL